MKKFLLMTLFAFGAVSVSFGDCVSSCGAVYGSDNMAMSRCISECGKNASSKQNNTTSLPNYDVPQTNLSNDNDAAYNVPQTDLSNDNTANRLKSLGRD